MNANLSERFRRGRFPNTQAAQTSSSGHGFDLSLNLDIREYVQKQDNIKHSSDKDEWLSQPEFPSVDELENEMPGLLVNKIEAPYKSKDKYLKTHYGLQREDAVGSLRDALQDFRSDPTTNDTHKFSVYDQVHIVGFTFARRGLAARIQFSTRRAGKRISWQTSKRLVSGSIVVLIRAKDKLADLKGLVVAVVAARPLAGVLAEPPEIDLYFSNPEAIQIDPQEEWIMIEAKQGYYEAYRHTLRALQKLSQESFPLADHICKLNPSVDPPVYLQQTPTIDLSAAAKGDEKKAYESIDVTQQWPTAPEDSLDDTQWEALQEMITKRLAIIQGPPGTGKTFVSKLAVEILRRNRKAGDSPIIITAQTNHALDQLLGHISSFEPDYVRLGGRSTNPEVKKRALFEIRQKERIPQIPGGLFGRSNNLITKQSKAMSSILEPLSMPGQDPYSTDQVPGPRVLQQLGVLNAAQAKSLEDGATQWVSTSNTMDGPIQLWLDRALVPFEVKYAKDNFGFQEIEDEDLEFEQLRENEDSHGVNDEEDIEMLKGPWINIREKFTVPPASSSDLTKANKLLDSATDLWKVPDYLRGPMFSIIQSRAKAALAKRFREAAVTFDKLVRENQVGKWEQDAVYLRRAPIIGMTTTGLSKYRALVSALKPKIILIEEAAEVLEAPVTVACIESLEHLILVGDHQQLQGHCSVQELEGEPFYLNVSLFERLVRNNMPYKTLLRQRRMDPEFRRLISDLYPNLSDHPSVLNRPVEPWGMGPLKSFFFEHSWSEYKDESLSTYNEEEAKFVAGFYRYLNKNGVRPDQITVLTFYNGQRKRLLKELRAYSDITAGYLQVKTVDSYQGEENDIVILSLTRSNEECKIGFLANINRVCVALSRAKYGFYMFGNSQALMTASDLWYNVIMRMSSPPKRIAGVFPIQCKMHQATCFMEYPEDWKKTEGGCFEYQALKQQEIWAEPDAESIRRGVQDIRIANGIKNGQSIPFDGSSIYSQQQLLPVRNAGPSYRDVALETSPELSAAEPKQNSPNKPNMIGQRTGGWNPTPATTIRTHHFSPEKQQERRAGWTDYAKGGVVADDKRRVDLTGSENQVKPTLRTDGYHELNAGAATFQPGLNLHRNTYTSPIKQETVKAMTDGRSRFLHNYQPEASRRREVSPSEDKSNKSKRQSTKSRGVQLYRGRGRDLVQSGRLDQKVLESEGMRSLTKDDNKAQSRGGSGVMKDLVDLDEYYHESDSEDVELQVEVSRTSASLL
ncbi:hypothetical protein LTR06_010382 [Exophiala xenobiotica]|nr:hypothetical protein LTR06_010382 [Exophiala xenobiotica]